jgi:predicted metal-binding membrane protein
MSDAAMALESLVRRDRHLVGLALCAVTAVAWIDLAYMARDMGAPGTMVHWSPGYFAAMFAMWAIMMLGMMIPSAAPAILLVSALRRRSHAGGLGATALFTAGYLIAWTGFSLLATTAQLALSEASLLSSLMTSEGPELGALLFIAAGLYQFSPLKRACLSKCRSPAQFLVEHWRDTRLGPLVVGVEHGAYCVGCCWAVMALLFVFGVMNLLWVALLAAFVLMEKLVPSGPRIGAWSGIVMLGVGVLLLNT